MCDRGRVHGLIHMIRTGWAVFSTAPRPMERFTAFRALSLSSFGIRKVHKSPNPGAWRSLVGLAPPSGHFPP